MRHNIGTRYTHSLGSAVVRLLPLLLVLLFTLWAATPSFAADKHKFTLVIDAGHGGKDGGACAHGAKEKSINLSVALAFGRLVEQNCPEVKVIYTRKTDVFVPLHKRADIANKNKADVFISIHTNSVESRKAVTGMETYTMGMRRSDEKRSAAMRENEVILIESDYKQHYAGFDPNSPESYIIFDMVNETNMAQSVELAQLIQKHVCATAGRPNKGVKQDAFLVLRETSMPACLIELGYITTASEATYLTKQANVDAMARGIYQAFVAYKKKHAPATTTQPAQPSQPSQTAPAHEEPAAEPETIEAPSGAVGGASPSGAVGGALGGVSVAHYDMRFLKPLDENILHEVGEKFKKVITIEDGVRNGGLGSAVTEWMSDHGYTPRITRLGLPDEFVEHGEVDELRRIVGLDMESIRQCIMRMLNA